MNNRYQDENVWLLFNGQDDQPIKECIIGTFTVIKRKWPACNKQGSRLSIPESVGGNRKTLDEVVSGDLLGNPEHRSIRIAAFKAHQLSREKGI